MKWIKAQWRETLAHLDLPLLLIVCVLSGIGLASIYSATASDGFWKLDRQIINMLGAAAVMLTVAYTIYSIRLNAITQQVLVSLERVLHL